MWQPVRGRGAGHLAIDSRQFCQAALSNASQEVEIDPLVSQGPISWTRVKIIRMF